MTENKNDKKSVSPFIQAALAMDADFAQIELLGGQLERLDIESDAGLERARLLLSRFVETGQRMGAGIQSLMESLQEARVRAEAAASKISTRATVIQNRQDEVDRMLQRFQALSEMARKVSEAMGNLPKASMEELTVEQKTLLLQKLPECDAQLSALIEEARQLKYDAQERNMKTLTRNADSMAQSLEAARRKLSASLKNFADRKQHATTSAEIHGQA